MADAQAKGHEDHDSPEYLRASIKVYISVGITLLLLTWFTVYVSTWDLRPSAAIYIALAIATIKGSLVAAWFMHLIDEKKIIYATMILAAFMFFAMLFGPLFTDGGSVGTESQMIEAPAPAHGGSHGGEH